ncbi:MAG TPA: DUF6569 family protein [Xanthobacteraceae bacterium]|nr:DUF6569 family protein [Xanthobacteraceae bacterium]
MSRWSMVALAGVSLSFVAFGGPTHAFAFDFQISNPASGGNLSVYFVEGNGPGGPGGSSIMSLDQAVAQGAAKVYQQRSDWSTDPTGHKIQTNGPVALENLSGQTIFLQLGGLVAGGLQDQVIARTTLVPPGPGRISIDTLCVDPFRSVARAGESAIQFSAPSALFPWRTAKVTALAANSEAADPQVFSRDVRQLGIWWSMDSLRTTLGQKLGVPLEPETPASWNEDEDLRANTLLADRHAGWKNSLPLSLQNPELAKAEEPYVHALEAKGANAKIIGAIFVINGQVEGADIYRSHDLFAQMWPKLLRAYATEAIAFSGAKRAHLPKLRQLRQFLTAAEQAPERDFGAGNSVHESDTAIYTTTVDKDGVWVYRSYVAKLPTDALLPEGVIVSILDSAKVDERALASIGDNEMVVLHHDRSDNLFAGTVEKNPDAAATIQAPVIGAVHVAPTRGAVNAVLNDRWQASVVTKPKIEDALPSIQVPDSSSNSAGFDFIVLLVGAFVFVAYLLFGFSLPPVGSWTRSMLSLTKRLWCNATGKLERLAAQARQNRKPVQSPPEVLVPTVVRRLSQAVRRRSYAERVALRRSRRVAPPKEDETQDLPLAA